MLVLLAAAGRDREDGHEQTKQRRHKIKNVTRIWSLLTLAVMVAIALAACQGPGKPQPVRSEIQTEAGRKLRLFHSGTEDVKREICLGEVIPVYRDVYGPFGEFSRTEVGQVKVLSYFGEHYFDAEIVSVNPRPGDIAKKGSAACLVQLARSGVS